MPKTSHREDLAQLLEGDPLSHLSSTYRDGSSALIRFLNRKVKDKNPKQACLLGAFSQVCVGDGQLSSDIIH
ncbi:unnamed protein product [Vitrella brassicaformis CCMP3155]|uniref:Uncharacterized protein n=1 Tax=Vitrella brassicaformis (strain CCMP3155) TaxID=1169540 RepID=A0A0G4FE12_VITBC|nr:unnamed protein product [Vitrella brassicaformis CCMP3155]|eukprot:CEM11199.1 unnamed protein product [Vitrella brassicaformis CCMP3155]